MDERVRRWVKPRRWDPVEEVGPYRSMTPAERLQALSRFCGWLVPLARAAAGERWRDEQDPMPPQAAKWWRELVRRARKSRRGGGAD